MTANAVKLYVYLLLKAKSIGVDQGVHRATTRAMSEESGINRIAMMRAIRELESMEPKPFIAVKRSTNQHAMTEYKILRFAGSESRPAKDDFAGTESVPAPIPADQPKQLPINGLASPKTLKTEENTNCASFRRSFDDSYPNWFERFWSLYPSTKGSKQTAFEKAAKVVTSDNDIELALRYLDIRQTHIKRMKAKEAFVESLPYVERYFSKGIWNQEPEIPATDGDGIRMAWQ